MRRGLLKDLANTLREQGDIDEREAFIDATFASAKGGGDAIGPTKRGKGVKIMAIVDRHGLPLSVSTHAANHHEVTLVQLSFDFYMIETKPEHLIGDKAYDSDDLDDKLKRKGVELIAPHATPLEECVIEFDAPSGSKMRIQWKASAPRDWVSLLRAWREAEG